MRLRFLLYATMLLLLGYGAMWYVEASAIQAHVEASLKHQRHVLKKTNPHARIQWDAIHRSGFPFNPSVRVVMPTLSMVYGDTSYSVGLEGLTFVPGSVGGVAQEGVAVLRPDRNYLRALYAKPNRAPEQYLVEWAPNMQVKLLAYPSGRRPAPCLPAQPCDTRPTNAQPFSHMRVTLPETLTLLVGKGQSYMPVAFTFSPLTRAALTQDRAIPNDITQPLRMFVEILREAHMR
jgi:hypothetical protein